MQMKVISRGVDKKLHGNNNLGKTTTACKFPKNLLLASEMGYNAIPGAMAQPINNWSEFKKVLKQLKEPAVQERFFTVTLDTVDLFYDFCAKYVLKQNNVEKVSDIPYGQGYNMIAKEFDECLREILKLNYGLVMISHSTDKQFKDEAGQEYQKIVPTLDKRGKLVTSRMVDIYAYSRALTMENGSTAVKLFLRGTPRFEAGSRFPYIPEYIDFNYNALVDAIHTSIEQQESEADNKDLFSDSRNNLYIIKSELDFDKLMEEFNSLVQGFIDSCKDEAEFEEKWAARIQEVIERTLGKGKKVNGMSRDQAELLEVICSDLKDIKK